MVETDTVTRPSSITPGLPTLLRVAQIPKNSTSIVCGTSSARATTGTLRSRPTTSRAPIASAVRANASPWESSPALMSAQRIRRSMPENVPLSAGVTARASTIATIASTASGRISLLTS